MRADPGKLDAGVGEEVERGRGAVGGAGGVTVAARSGAIGVDRRGVARTEAAGERDDQRESHEAPSPCARGEGWGEGLT